MYYALPCYCSTGTVERFKCLPNTFIAHYQIVKLFKKSTPWNTLIPHYQQLNMVFIKRPEFDCKLTTGLINKSVNLFQDDTA
jgi:hypothetical protein